MDHNRALRLTHIKHAMSKTRSRRLRKKLHLGEFKELGFCFEAKLKGGVDQHVLLDTFLTEAIAAQGLSFGGWVTGGAVEKHGPGSVSIEQRQFVLAWLKRRPEVEALTASELIDMWYSDGLAVSLTGV
jgi:uncharacterized protein YggL (DUF469 family)